ncbi:tetratricopeptide (TPR) repeat protein [Paenibacillus mucilaginosus]|uniref:O-antigen ligase family protein n=1 Tax=Paenibacillus mucilaginosus TaxID=61624 RepID=UPI003D1C0642
MSSKKKYYVPSYTGGKQALEDEADSKHSILFWILTAITAIILFWAPFQKGLFNGNNFDFERSIYSTLVWAGITLLLVAIYSYYQWNFRRLSDLLSIGIWLIPLSFIISLGSAASNYSATNMVYITTAYAAFFLVGFFIARSQSGSRILVHLIMASGYVIVWFGLMNWFGHKETAYNLVSWFAADMPTMKEYQDAIMADHNGVRLTSVFQYGNAYAAFLIAMLLCGLYIISTSKKRIETIYHGFMLVPIFISFFLTLSRGALVIIPVVFIVIMLIMAFNKQVTYLLHTLVLAVIALVVLSPITNVGVEQVKQYNGALAAKGWLYLLAASVIFTAVTVLVNHLLRTKLEQKLERVTAARYSQFYIPAGSVLAGALGVFLLLGNTGILNLFPENIKQRIENINFQQNSVLERGTFYKDALKLYADYPVFGAGGGAWSAMYEKYQNNPYVSRQAHNFFLQYLVEVGTVGFIIFALILALIFYIFIRSYRKKAAEGSEGVYFVFFIAAVSLLIHSSLDFDLSFVYLGILLFLCLGAMNSIDEVEWKAPKEAIQKYKWTYPSVILVIALLYFFNSIQLLNGNRNFGAARAEASTNKNVNEIFTPLNKALSQHPGHPDYSAFKIDILYQLYNQTKDEKYYTEAVELTKQTLLKEPFHRSLIDRELHGLTIKESLAEALERTNQEIPNFPWDITLYEKSITLSTELGMNEREKKNEQQANVYWDQALNTYKQIETRVAELAKLPEAQVQGRAFGITAPISLALGEIHFYRGNYSEAENILRSSINGSLDEQVVVANIRWYLAALQKQGKNDQALMDRLLAKDPTEKQKIESLVNAKL